MLMYDKDFSELMSQVVCGYLSDFRRINCGKYVRDTEKTRNSRSRATEAVVVEEIPLPYCGQPPMAFHNPLWSFEGKPVFPQGLWKTLKGFSDFSTGVLGKMSCPAMEFWNIRQIIPRFSV